MPGESKAIKVSAINTVEIGFRTDIDGAVGYDQDIVDKYAKQNVIEMTCKENIVARTSSGVSENNYFSSTIGVGGLFSPSWH
jgi:hypothetical protein